MFVKEHRNKKYVHVCPHSETYFKLLRKSVEHIILHSDTQLLQFHGGTFVAMNIVVIW